MRHRRSSSPLAPAVLTAAAALCLVAPTASAARRPATRAEALAIKRAAMNACRTPAGPCHYDGGRVSTRNPRYAWGAAVGEGFSGTLLKRPSARSLRFRVIGTQGGGISACSYWRARAPAAVLRDLRISGLLDSSGAAGSCG